MASASTPSKKSWQADRRVSVCFVCKRQSRLWDHDAGKHLQATTGHNNQQQSEWRQVGGTGHQMTPKTIQLAPHSNRQSTPQPAKSCHHSKPRRAATPPGYDGHPRSETGGQTRERPTMPSRPPWSRTSGRRRAPRARSWSPSRR